MVSISRQRLKGGSASSAAARIRTRRGGSKYDVEKLLTLGLAIGGGCLTVWVLMSLASSSSGGGGGSGGSSSSSSLKSRIMTPNHPDLHLQGPNREAYNAIAADIILTLQCRDLLNKTVVENNYENFGGGGGGAGGGGGFDEGHQQEGGGAAAAAAAAGDGGGGAGLQEGQQPQQQVYGVGEEGHFRRRLEEEDGGERDFGMDDFMGDGGGWDNTVSPSAAHLFCLAAMSYDPAWEEKLGEWKNRIQCDPTYEQRQLALLDVWSTVRVEMQDSVLKTTLDVATEQERDLIQERMHLWAPPSDDGMEYMLGLLNEEQKSADHGGIYGLENNLGPGKLFVDVGGGLGLTSMAIALLYPGTRIVSMEAAAPNWLLQQVNWICNTDNSKLADTEANLMLAGVGPKDKSAQVAKFTWRPTATTSARSWTSSSERQDGDVELTIKLRPWHSILAEAGVNRNSIDVLNLHCEGCEYNLIPSLNEDEFDAIHTVMGSVHWGYIPTSKKPSSSRASITHKRLCRHENFARDVKECCAFPDLAVLSSVPGEVLIQDSKRFPPHDVTVKDVAGGLCDNFDSWAAENHLYNIESDWGWFQITSMAEE